MKYRSSKGVTINIPDGLTPKQINAIKADADAGYGSRAQETATKLGKGASSGGAQASGGLDTGALPVDAGAADLRQAARLAWLKKNRPNDPEIKRLEQSMAAGGGAPGQGGEGYGRGSVDSFLDGVLDNFKQLDLSGAPKVLSADDLEASRQMDQDALYREETQYLDRNRARDLEETKQELANRGIPFDPAAAQNPNTGNLYGRTVGAVNENYQAQQQSALDRARTGSYERMATAAGVNKTAYDAFTDSALKGYQSQLDELNTGNALVETLMREFGLTEDAAIARLKIKTDAKLAREQIKAAERVSGSSGGGRAKEPTTGGFDLPS
jgi:hypothetical protein